MSRAASLVMAVACGLTVANIYYNQPLLGILTAEFGPALVGYVPTATQVGYMLGILTLVPLGDRTDRRTLIVAQSVVLAGALAIAATAPSAAVLLAASLLVGIASTVPQQIIPLAAVLASPERRGRVIGTVMSGLLCGILLARTVAGAVGAHQGWRAVFWLAIVLALGTAAVMAATLPSRPPKLRLSYAQLVASTAALARDEPRLRVAAATQMLLFGSFSVFWTVLALHLERPPFGLGADAAGLFGLVGAAGALVAPLAGHVADRRGPRFGIGVCIALAVAAWGVLLIAPHSLPALVLGVVLLDAGVQGAMIGAQHVVFALRPDARNRVNTVLVSAVFGGGSIGSAASVLAWQSGGWIAVCRLGAAFAGAAAVLHACTGPGGVKRPSAA